MGLACHHGERTFESNDLKVPASLVVPQGEQQVLEVVILLILESVKRTCHSGRCVTP